MGQHKIRYSCGHEGTVTLNGPRDEQEARLRWYKEKAVCPDCYKEQMEIEKSVGKECITMSYKEYKEDFSDCESKQGSYDGENKTITVYVPKGDKRLKKRK